ncbi:hypothetical protein QQS45_07270 [Alteriqipengyuania flavescens]|uniref:hypothetical protein n=1 Tax=Alteriqipengyuania flavescens TaxID=3053610 RepID=UPI0025B2C2F6|nr:hypothetical protein [Alteriqipengyuania flavescens]WJY17471.1 hypothetical protein QQW98_07260 [Alteriqipengyuania flavescens]WJY23414.1 hypothetical protein QQS45_07270 [Alteriqipengyuania flavescens]
MLDELAGNALRLALDHAADAAHPPFGPFDDPADLALTHPWRILDALDRLVLDLRCLGLGDMNRPAADKRTACRRRGEFGKGRTYRHGLISLHQFDSAPDGFRRVGLIPFCQETGEERLSQSR